MTPSLTSIFALAVGATQQRRDGIAGAAQGGVAVQLAQTAFHALYLRKELLQLQAAGGKFRAARHGRLRAIQVDIRVQLAAGQAEVQRRQRKHTVLHHRAHLQIGDRADRRL